MGRCAEMRQKLARRQEGKIRQFREERGFDAQIRRLEEQIAEIQVDCHHDSWQTNWTITDDTSQSIVQMGTDEYHSKPRLPKITRTCQECDLGEERTIAEICPKCGQKHQFIGQYDSPYRGTQSGGPKITIDQIPKQYHHWIDGPQCAHYLRLYRCEHCNHILVIADCNAYVK